MTKSEMEEFIVQITSGRGPEECCRAVAKVLEAFLKEARLKGFKAEVLENVPGNMNGTLLSSTLVVRGKKLYEFLKTWKGSILWISKSPYRKFHKRKNWFVGFDVFSKADLFQWKLSDVKIETMRSSGPGGQHVNKTESAVRAKHIPSGITVTSSERRSQIQNKSEALERLQKKVIEWSIQQTASTAKDQWQNHNELERGNPVRTFNESLV